MGGICSAMIGSLPSRGAWIEMEETEPNEAGLAVAPLAGSVDRNFSRRELDTGDEVAPLAGSVDRNSYQMTYSLNDGVAPLAGSVDRNQGAGVPLQGRQRSLPARGAWIEIYVPHFLKNGMKSVAPLAGSVDRNYGVTAFAVRLAGRSPRGERG